MILEGVVMGSLTMGGLYFVYEQLPERVKDWMAAHPLLFDASSTYLTWVIHYGTATGVVAAAWAGILAHCLMYVKMHQEDYVWVNELMDSVKISVRVLLNWMRDAVRSFAALLKGVVEKTDRDLRVA